MMKKRLLNEKGITFFSLVFLIVILSLVVSISLFLATGENSIFGQVKKTIFMDSYEKYTEELEAYIATLRSEEEMYELTTREKAFIKKYIPSMSGDDLNEYIIIEGVLYYVGNDKDKYEICVENNYKFKPLEMNQDEFVASIEGVALEAVLKEMAGDVLVRIDEMDRNETKIGTPLAMKPKEEKLGSEKDWKVIVELEDGKIVSTYGDGWYFVERGTAVYEIGVLKHSYMLNYTTKKAVRFVPSKHVFVTNAGTISNKDGLVYSADIINFDESKPSWDNFFVTGFTGEVKTLSGKLLSGWENDSFVTDGIDDKIEIELDKYDFSEGITVECIFKIENIKEGKENTYLFTKGKDLENSFTVGILGNENVMEFGNKMWFGYKGYNAWEVDVDTLDNKEVYVTLKFDKENPSGELYINNVKQSIINQNTNDWEHFQKILNDKETKFTFGKIGDEYSKVQLRALRIYNRCLSENEVTANYNMTSAYYEMIKLERDINNENNEGVDFSVIK